MYSPADSEGLSLQGQQIPKVANSSAVSTFRGKPTDPEPTARLLHRFPPSGPPSHLPSPPWAEFPHSQGTGTVPRSLQERSRPASPQLPTPPCPPSAETSGRPPIPHCPTLCLLADRCCQVWPALRTLSLLGINIFPVSVCVLPHLESLQTLWNPALAICPGVCLRASVSDPFSSLLPGSV